MPKSRNSPPPVYRPSQPPTSAPPVYRPGAAARPVQPKPARPDQPRAPQAPPVYRPVVLAQKPPVFAPVPRLAVQRKPMLRAAPVETRGGSPAPPRFLRSQQGRSVQRIRYSEVKAALSTTDLGIFKNWMADLNVIAQGGRMGDDPGLTREQFLHQYDTVGDLQAQLDLYKSRVAAEPSFGATELDAVIDEIYDAFRNSAVVPAAAKPARSTIAGAITVLDEGAFNIAHFQNTAAHNPTLNREDLGLRDARLVTQVEGFERGGRIALRKGQVNAHIAVHELLHMVADPGVAAQLGKVFNEGLTENLARRVCTDASIAHSDSYYQGERAVVDQVSTLLHWDLALQKRAYFEDPTAISSQLRLQLGNDGFADFITKKSAAEASLSFRDGSARQRKRINLRTEVRAGLTAYADRWKFNPSDASTHAVGRLNALIDRLEILADVVRYYLLPTAAAPGGGLNLGSKLKTDSSLHEDLSAAFGRWQLANP